MTPPSSVRSSSSPTATPGKQETTREKEIDWILYFFDVTASLESVMSVLP